MDSKIIRTQRKDELRIRNTNWTNKQDGSNYKRNFTKSTNYELIGI